MLTKDFYFDLPEELIAQYPSGIRGEDKLMLLNRNGFIQDKTDSNLKNSTDGKAIISDYLMQNLPDLIDSDTLMVFNNSRVRKSRCYGKSENSEKETEFLLLQQLPSDNDCSVWKAMVKNAKKQKPGKVFVFADGTKGVIQDNLDDIGTEFRTIQFDKTITEAWFEYNGHIPLPPYIKRGDTKEDSERYQNVYAKETGSAACPTAGLHFTEEMIQKLTDKHIDIAYVTLHVGLGTFLPVRAEKIENHKMHQESFSITDDTAKKINQAKLNNKKILAIGTTSVRTLESAWNGLSVFDGGGIIPGTHSTGIFIYPGYKFRCVDMMFTNFHTPESTLMMLVSAFAGFENIKNSYSLAIANKYRFFSYGDAMLIK